MSLKYDVDDIKIKSLKHPVVSEHQRGYHEPGPEWTRAQTPKTQEKRKR
jgi:hypothetical protein